MSPPLLDDGLWALVESLLPKRRRVRWPSMGRPRIPDRAALTGILFVWRAGVPWQMLPKEMGCGSGSTCWRRLVQWQRAGVWRRLHEVLLTEWRRRGRLDLARAIVDSRSVRALRGGKHWTEPYRSPQERVETSHSHRRARDSDCRAADRRQPQRHHRTAAVGRCVPDFGRPARAAPPATRLCPRGPRLRFSAPSRRVAPTRDSDGAGEAPDTARQRFRADAVGRRTHLGLASSLPPPQRPL